MRFTKIVLVILVTCGTASPAFAQNTPFPLTDKLSNLDGTWRRDPSRGTGGICGVPVAEQVSFKVSPAEIAVDTGQIAGVFKLDGSRTQLWTGTTGSASLDAGWLAVTVRFNRNGGYTNIMREVYSVLRNELTIWRTLNVEVPGGGPGKIDCGNHHAIVYTRPPA